eukprot:NODE_133_length_18153_cov_0.298050.p3 type:complete len:441 gc:universal NODE_133_length_18153_cov_0.298050:335-1657(+)
MKQSNLVKNLSQSPIHYSHDFLSLNAQDSYVKPEHMNILLLEGVSQVAVDKFKSYGFDVELIPRALPRDELLEKVKEAHVIGIRSKTQLDKEALENAKNLLAVGCFCIGTNQVDLSFAANRGIPVFNSPFSNSRSVAELMISEIITLGRKLGDMNMQMHQGNWQKISKGCYEIRGKTLGIVGYGHIGSQLSVLAEALGMKVIFYDILPIMPLGSASSKHTLSEVLSSADYVTLHVPLTDETENMIDISQLRQMKKGAYFINASRGNVVNLDALADVLESGHLAGAAIDVFPEEPESNGIGFKCKLMGLKNVILTPHIGGSTEEAQTAIGLEVALSIANYLTNGTTQSAVNFPQVSPKNLIPPCVRIINVHKNVPGVLNRINTLLSKYNIERQLCEAYGEISYFLADVNTGEFTDDNKIDSIRELMRTVDAGVLTRVLATQ